MVASPPDIVVLKNIFRTKCCCTIPLLVAMQIVLKGRLLTLIMNYLLNQLLTS
jgi:hypothetical protein